MNRLLSCLFVIALAGTGIGTLIQEPVRAASSKRLFIVFLDETGSSGVENPWSQAVGLASELARRIGPDDAFVLIGIDDHAGDPGDVRIPMQAMDPNPIRAMGMKRQLALQIKRLTVRNPQSKNTDILGAIATASQLALRHTEYRPILAFFSDMDQFPKLPTVSDVRSLGISFPANAEARVFLFNAVAYANRNKMQVAPAEIRLKQTWLSVFRAARVRAEDQDFVPMADTVAVFNRLYPPQM